MCEHEAGLKWFELRKGSLSWNNMMLHNVDEEHFYTQKIFNQIWRSLSSKKSINNKKNNDDGEVFWEKDNETPTSSLTADRFKLS